MRIRKEQMQAFEAAAWRNFETRMVDHWLESFPKKFQDFDRHSMHAVARAAIVESTANGLETERDIVMYSDLALANHTGFAADLQGYRDLKRKGR